MHKKETERLRKSADYLMLLKHAKTLIIGGGVYVTTSRGTELFTLEKMENRIQQIKQHIRKNLEKNNATRKNEKRRTYRISKKTHSGA